MAAKRQIPFISGSRSRLLRLALAGAVFGVTAAGTRVEASMSESPRVDVSATLRAAVAVDGELSEFYRSRGYRSLWSSGSSLRPEALQVVRLIEGSEHDGLDPAAYQLAELAAAVRRAGDGSPISLARAEVLLSRAFADYVRDLRRPRAVEMHYVDHELAPGVLTSRAILAAAAEAPSLASYIEGAVRMNPIYTRIRDAYAKHRAGGSGRRLEDSVFRANLERARALPVDLGRRFVLVDAASARLWMYDAGKVTDSMRVIVGRTSEQTPLMAAFVRFAALNPYWNVPPDLVQRRIAPEVLSQGVAYLRKAKYQVLSDWSEEATVVDPASIDWAAVAAGRIKLPVRQDPGAQNPMGNVKFMFPNERGIYLHDTPNKALFEQSDRRQSSGCVRLEDASRLARWMFQRDVAPKSAAPEQHVKVPEPIPVYITYLTVAPDRDQLAFHNDVYGRDGQLIAQLDPAPAAKGRGPVGQEPMPSFSLLSRR